jgi:hypothetical protein
MRKQYQEVASLQPLNQIHYNAVHALQRLLIIGVMLAVLLLLAWIAL